MDGLREVGVEPVSLTLGAPPAVSSALSAAVALRYLRPASDVRSAVRAARGAARASPTMAWIESALTSSGVGSADGLDGLVQIGTGVTLRTDVPVVTLEDMTVAQNREHPYEQYARLSERALSMRITRQQESYDRATACCFMTDWAADSASQDYVVPADKIHVVGVGAPRFNCDHERDWSTPRFLFVGADWQRKNGDAVLRAFRKIRQSFPEARLELVGGHPPITEDGVHPHGMLRRGVPEERRVVERLFCECTCFVMPSFLEAAGIVYLEAAATGMPVIGTSVGGASFLIGDGGLVVDPHDDDAIVDAMWAFADSSTAAAVGARGLERARLFTWPAVADRLIGALDGRPPSRWWRSSDAGSDEPAR